LLEANLKAQDPFKDWIKKDYTIDYLIKKDYLKPECKTI
jgi:hypothetical protein